MGTDGSSPTWRHGPVLGGEGERPEIELEPIFWVPKPVPGASRRARRTRRVRQLRWLVASLLAVLVVVGSLAVVPLSIPGRAAVADEAFRRRAGAACAATGTRLEALPRGPGADAPAPARADAVERWVDELAVLAADLRALAAPGDPSAVTAWLDDWDAYVGSGRAFAAATRGGDEDAREAADRDGQRLRRRLDGFAFANGMGDCAIGAFPR